MKCISFPTAKKIISKTEQPSKGEKKSKKIKKKMDKTNKKMLTQIKSSPTPIDNYPLIISLNDFLQKKNENIYDFSNWLNFTLQILTTNQISFNEFLSKITFIQKDENLSTELFKK